VSAPANGVMADPDPARAAAQPALEADTGLALADRHVERRTAPPPKRFLAEHVAPRRPVILTDLTADWGAQRWSTAYLSHVAGEREVPVYDSQPARERAHQHAAANTLPLAEFLNRLEHGEKDLRMFFYNLLAHAPELTGDIAWPKTGLRLFRRLPVLFIGGRGARVQMHFDIDLADNLLCHFGGTKRVLLFPPEQSDFMYRVPYSFSSLFPVDFEKPDLQRFPGLARLSGQLATLSHGDVLYIPNGWWHYVLYDDIGFSISLRAFPSARRILWALLKNVLWLRNVDALGRRLIGQRWNDRNEAAAIARVSERLAR